MKFAWVENGVIRDVCNGDPSTMYHPDVAAMYASAVPDDASGGDSWVNGVLTKYEPPVGEVVVTYPQLTPLEFKMCFTTAERIAIKTAKENDPVLQDTYEILDDVRLKTVDLNLASNRALIDYLVSLSLITSDRAAQIKQGVQL